jgi:molybdopterin/thiamine biosynthesis adenylyltransferase
MTDQYSDLSRYARQVIFPGVGEEGQRKLLGAHVAIVGCGATGSTLANSLVRAGIGRVRIIDRDFIELNNLQRQVLFDEDDISRGLPKAIAAAEKLRRINSTVQIEPVVADVNANNILELIGDADVVLDGTDNFDTRYLINDACVRLLKPWVYSGVIASYGMTMTIIPGQTACLRCLYPNPPAPGTTATCDTAGVLNTVVGVVPNIAANEALKLIIGQGELNTGLIHVDLWSNTFDVFNVPRLADCPACGRHEFEFLSAEAGSQTTSLCGRNAVQVRMRAARLVRFEDLAARLASAGEVSFNEFILRFKVNGYEMTVFPDSRAIIKGTDDETLAKTLYAKYIGM